MDRIPLCVPNLTGNEKKYLNDCIDSTFVSSVGLYVAKFEQLTAEATGSSYAAATSSGTTALQMALLACGVQQGTIVILPSFTFIATANAVTHCGAFSWCIDIDQESWTMSPEGLEQALKENVVYQNGMVVHKATGRRVAAILPVYTLGTTADMDRINEIAKQYRLPVVADAAAAVGATYKGKNIGDIADISTISFNGNKTVTAGGGGMVVSNNKQYIDYIHHCSSTARVGTEYIHDMVGYNYRITNLQAAVGCAQMERSTELVAKKRNVRLWYKEQLQDLTNIELFPEPSWGESACWFSGIILKDSNYDTLKKVCCKLDEMGIEARSFWRPVHMQKPYQNCFHSELPKTEQLWSKIITLPSSTGIGIEDLKYVTDTLRMLLGGRGLWV